MPAQQTLIAISIPLIFLGLLLGGVMQAEDRSLQPASDNVLEQLAQYDSEVTIDGGDGNNAGEIAEKRFRGLVAWNMLAGQHCTYPLLVAQGNDLQGEPGFTEGIAEDLVLENDIQAGSDGELDDLRSTGDTATFFDGRHNLGTSENYVRALLQDEDMNFDGHCMGIEPLEIPELDLLSRAIGSLPDLSDPAPIVEMDGESLQGTYGRVDFTINDSFIIEDNRLIGMELGRPAENDADYTPWGDTAYNSPDFVRADRMGIFYYDGVLPDDSNMAGDPDDHLVTGGLSGSTRNSERETVRMRHLGETYSPGTPTRSDNIYPYRYNRNNDLQSWREAFSAYRVRMKDVPHVASTSLYSDFEDWVESTDDSEVSGTGFTNNNIRRFFINWDEVDNDLDDSRERYYIRAQNRYLSGRTHYLLCEGMEGHIQSNAGRIDESGKRYQTADSPITRDVVYPKVEITNIDSIDVEECYEDVTGRSIQTDVELRGRGAWIRNNYYIPDY